MKASVYIASNDLNFKNLLTETFMDNPDFSLLFLNKTNYTLLCDKPPKIFVVDLKNMDTVNKLFSLVIRNITKIIYVNGETTYFSKSIKYYLTKPVYPLELKQMFYNCLNNTYLDYHSKKLESRLSDIFITVGIPANTKGYRMLINAVKIVIANPEYSTMVTKKLYPAVAKNLNTSPSMVERDIRHSIFVAHSKGTLQNINKIFGAKIITPELKPTNSEFISLMAEHMMLEGFIE